MNILTFDVEEWFHILDNESTRTSDSWSAYQYRLEENMDRIFELLARNNQQATFFVLGWVAEKFPQILRKIYEEGYDIASHSYMHQLVYTQDREEFRKDLNDSLNVIEDTIGEKVVTYRAPGFSVGESNCWVFEELLNCGIELDCSVFPASRSHGGFSKFGAARPSVISVNGMRLKEFPINVSTVLFFKFVFSGGGYFRLLPYSVIKSLAKKSPYLMTYFHPRDFDAEQPVIPQLSLVRKFKSYYGLGSSLSKLEVFIKEFEFINLKEANRLVDWNCADVINM